MLGARKDPLLIYFRQICLTLNFLMLQIEKDIKFCIEKQPDITQDSPPVIHLYINRISGILA
jgi:hypothetical protein